MSDQSVKLSLTEPKISKCLIMEINAKEVVNATISSTSGWNTLRASNYYFSHASFHDNLFYK